MGESISTRVQESKSSLDAHSDLGKKYLYAFGTGDLARTYGCIGIDGAEVYTITNGHVTAVVSDLPIRPIRPERRHLAAHQKVLRQLMGETTPLPVSFGVTADHPQAVQDLLSAHQKDILEQLDRVAGKVEMGLRVVWDVPNIFEYFVNTHAELRRARDLFFGGGREPTQEERMELGRMFERILEADRETCTERVERALAPYCTAIKRNRCQQEREVIHLACLIRREEQTRFEDAVFAAARGFDNSYSFDYNGPWAPHNFVELHLQP